MTFRLRSTDVLRTYVNELCTNDYACATHCEFIALNGQTTTSKFNKLVQQYYDEMAKTVVVYVKCFHDIVRQKLSKFADVSRSYSKNLNGTFL